MNFSFDAMSYPYASRRSVVYGRRGMVATANPLAAQAGLEILKQGGNAIDAMIATAAALTVVEPTANGIGSDAFALVWVKDKLYGLNASGPAPAAMTLEALQSRGFKEMPVLGMLPVTVPGTPAGWAALSKRFGRLPLSQVVEPAARYAVCRFAWAKRSWAIFSWMASGRAAVSCRMRRTVSSESRAFPTRTAKPSSSSPAVLAYVTTAGFRPLRTKRMSVTKGSLMYSLIASTIFFLYMNSWFIHTEFSTATCTTDSSKP